ncbi:response regulator [Nocardioides caldifontis]|uniref:response regulator n=1 Tax=Nocardioides caldifontis TaxID=2588938 RepID=UPI001EF101E3|nr:response regulator transcription factor [Nocardioides caldifontis]
MAEPAPGPRVLLVDDHPMFREGVRFTLTRAGVPVVGEAEDGEAAVELARRLDPDVVVMDLAMPGAGGLAATRALVAEGTRARILVLTMSGEDTAVLAAVRAGAHGYLVKGVGPDEVVAAVRAVAAGHAVFGPELAGRVLELIAAPGSSSPPAPWPPELSEREREVLELVAQGLSNQRIAERLFISPITVRNHVSHILTKLQLSDRREVMLRYAARRDP